MFICLCLNSIHHKELVYGKKNNINVYLLFFFLININHKLYAMFICPALNRPSPIIIFYIPLNVSESGEIFLL